MGVLLTLFKIDTSRLQKHGFCLTKPMLSGCDMQEFAT